MVGEWDCGSALVLLTSHEETPLGECLPIYLENATKQTRGSVSHCGLAIYIKKYFNVKEESWKFKYFTMQNYDLQKLL